MTQTRYAGILANQRRYLVKDFLVSVVLSAGLLAAVAAVL